MDLRIDPDFANNIPPLTEEEFQQLEENILADGVVINPIIVWNGVIVDGHNRYQIIQKHPEIGFTTHQKEFPDRNTVLAWICKNQLGRRNLTPEQRKYVIGKQYEAEKASYGGDRKSDAVKSSYQNDNLKIKEKTCERIAKENGISSISVLRAENFAKAVDIADEKLPGIRGEILSGSLKPTDKEIQALARADPQACAEMAEELRKPKKDRDLSKLSMLQINQEMLHQRSIGRPSSMIYEMADALDSLIFRWEFCHTNYRPFFSDAHCIDEIKQLIQKGHSFLTAYEGGI